MTRRAANAHDRSAVTTSATPRATPEGQPIRRQEAFIALSKFVVANGMIGEVKVAFRNRPHLVDEASGFARMEVLVPRDSPDEIWLITYWADEDSYRAWHHSHLYHESHKGIPTGLKLVPHSAEIRLFDVLCS